MKLIIDIDETDYRQIRAFDEGVTAYQLTLRLYDAVSNGTPLPKGHGRLIDADAFAIRGEYLEKLYGSDFYWEFKKQLDKHPTIIEADKESRGMSHRKE